MTNKKLNIVLAGVLCSVGVMAQESTPVIDQKKDEAVNRVNDIFKD